MDQGARQKLLRDCERVLQGGGESEVFRKLDGAKLFVTGGTGFLGSWICHFLQYLKTRYQFNFKVYVLARDKEAFSERLEGIGDLDIELIRCDIKNLNELPKDINYVIHAAGSPDSRFHMSNPIETMVDIAEGTRAVLRAAERLSGLRMIVHFSSGSVYGSQAEDLMAIDEDHSLAGTPLDSVKSVYTEAKRYSEVLCAAARNELRLPITILRPFTFLGPFQSLDAPWAINNFINDGLGGRPIRILGNGRTIRGFLYGADAAAWTLKILLGGKPNQIYNIGSPQGYSLLEIAEKVADNFRPRPEILLNASLVPNVAQSRYLANIGKLKSDHGLDQYTSLDLAIGRTIDWYRSSPGKLKGN